MTSPDSPIELGPLGRKDRAKAIKLAARMFAHLGPEREIIKSLRLVDENASLALRRKGELVGVYLVRKPNLTMFGDMLPPYYSDCRALRVEGLAILPSIRGQGYGRLLRAALPANARRQGYDYIWGAALKALDNKADWLKRRVLEREDEHCIVTIEPLNAAMRERLADKATPELLARWTGDDRTTTEAIEGKIVLETTAEGQSIPWVIGQERAYHGDPLNDARDTRALSGKLVRAFGRTRAETFDGPVIFKPEEAVDQIADDDGMVSCRPKP